LKDICNLTLAFPDAGGRIRGSRRAFTLVEVVLAVGILAVAFVGLFGTIRQANKLVAAAEDGALVECALEQRMDQLRALEWPELTTAAGLKTKIFVARPDAVSGYPVTGETLTISPVDVPDAQTLTATWTGTSTPTATVSAGTTLTAAKAVKVVATLTWTERRLDKSQTRSLMTVISRGGISKSDRP
jgi:prepilin-type N-terminal cleavage/methylation domain-containing protein